MNMSTYPKLILNHFFNPCSRWYYHLRWLFLILLGGIIYGQVFGYGFVFDDNYFIHETPYIRSFNYVNEIWLNLPKTRLIGVYSLAFNYWLNQLHPQGYHIFNVLVHLLSVGLVWGCASVLFKIVGWTPFKNQVYQELPFCIAILFLVHPCQTEAVSYISQRFESMATLFYLGSIYAYLSARISTLKVHRIVLFGCSLISAILGVFTKEIAATIPLMILAAEFILFDGKPVNAQKSGMGARYVWITVMGIVFVLVFMKMVRTDFINIYFHFNEMSQSHDGDIITGGKYLLTQMRVFLTFLRLLILPIYQNLDYDYPLSTGLIDPPLTLVGIGVIGLIIFLIFRLRKQWPLIAFGLAWVLISFSINTAPRTNLIFEHKLYLISFGFLIVVVAGLSVVIKDREVLCGVLIAWALMLSVLSVERNQVWKNEMTLWTDVVKKSPRKARPYVALGVISGKQGDFVGSLSYFNKAIELNPNYAEAYNNRGNSYYKLGNYPQALDDLNKAIKINPNYVDAYVNRGEVYDKEGNLIQALSDYDKALVINQNYIDVYYNRGVLYEKRGNLRQAILDFDRVIELNPTLAEAYIWRGNIFDEQGNPAQAQINYKEAFDRNPDYVRNYVSSYHKQGVDLAKRGDFDQAIIYFNKALKINPDNAEIYINRGTCYAQQGNLAQALSDYNMSITLAPDGPQAFYDRAVLYYQLKKYDKAWDDISRAQGFGAEINPQFISALKKDSGR